MPTRSCLFIYEEIIECVRIIITTRDDDEDDESNRANKHRVDDRYRALQVTCPFFLFPLLDPPGAPPRLYSNNAYSVERNTIIIINIILSAVCRTPGINNL